MVSHAVKALKAIKITSELNFRIRLSYACARLIFIPFIGSHLFVWTNPLAFTTDIIRRENPKMQQQKLPDGKNKFLVSPENAGKYSRCRWQNRSVSLLPLFAILSLQIKKNGSSHFQDDPTHGRADPCVPVRTGVCRAVPGPIYPSRAFLRAAKVK